MFVPAWAWKAAPYVGGVLLAGGAALWLIDNGRDAERAEWQAKVATEQAKVRRLEQQWRDEHARADAADVARLTAQDALMAALQRKVTVYAQSNEGRACGLDAAGGMLANEAIAAANRTVAAGSGPR